MNINNLGKGYQHTLEQSNAGGRSQQDAAGNYIFCKEQSGGIIIATNNEPPKISGGGTGVKHDQDKADMSLLSNTALLKVAQVMTYGKKKYSAHNWRGGFIWSRPLAAAARHLFAYINGEDKDQETGISHLAHACCCLFFILEFEETHRNLDDRYKGQSNASNKE